jgi:hypothetical protein
MSKFSSPHLGKITQASGGVSFTTWKGINVMKAKATTVANPQTEKQMINRGKFTSIVRYARQILTGLNISLKSLAIKKSQYNVFVGQNVDKIDSATGKLDINFITNIVLSRGTLEGFINLQVISSNINTVVVGWSNSGYNPNTSSSDKVYAYMYSEDNDEFVFISGNVTRVDSSWSIPIPINFPNGGYYSVWLFLGNETNNASNNVFVERIQRV